MKRRLDWSNQGVSLFLIIMLGFSSVAISADQISLIYGVDMQLIFVDVNPINQHEIKNSNKIFHTLSLSEHIMLVSNDKSENNLLETFLPNYKKTKETHFIHHRKSLRIF